MYIILNISISRGGARWLRQSDRECGSDGMSRRNRFFFFFSGVPRNTRSTRKQNAYSIFVSRAHAIIIIYVPGWGRPKRACVYDIETVCRRRSRYTPIRGLMERARAFAARKSWSKGETNAIYAAGQHYCIVTVFTRMRALPRESVIYRSIR